jgi:hypothetical protein
MQNSKQVLANQGQQDKQTHVSMCVNTTDIVY